MDQTVDGLGEWAMVDKPKKLAQIMNHILTGLSFIHDHGKMHGNINLQNSIISSELISSTVLYSKQSTCWKLTDFGLVPHEMMMEAISTENSHETTGDSSTEKMGYLVTGLCPV